MKLKTKIQLALGFTVVMAVLIGYMVVATFMNQAERSQTVALLDELDNQNQGFVTAIHEFLMYEAPRPLSQIQSNVLTMKGLLKTAQKKMPNRRNELLRIRHAIDEIGKTLRQFRQTGQAAVAPDSAFAQKKFIASARTQARKKRLSSRIMVRTQVVRTAVRKIHGQVDAAADERAQRYRLTFVALLFILVLGTLLATAWMYSSLIPGFQRLRDGTRRLRDGDLDFVLSSVSNDELGELTESFNNMVAQLKVKEVLIDRSQQIAHIGSWHLDIAADVLTWSPENYRIFDAEPGSPQDYASFLKRVHPDDRTFVDNTFTDAISQKKPYECIHRILRQDGTVRIVHEKSEETVDEAGNVTHSFGFTHDVTEQKAAETERERLIHELQASIEEIQLLRGILPICSFCKNVRNDSGYYEQLEEYLRKHSDVKFSHTVCPSCMETHYPEEFAIYNKKRNLSHS